jgi:hypothetical protein
MASFDRVQWRLNGDGAIVVGDGAVVIALGFFGKATVVRSSRPRKFGFRRQPDRLNRCEGFVGRVVFMSYGELMRGAVFYGIIPLIRSLSWEEPEKAESCENCAELFGVWEQN